MVAKHRRDGEDRKLPTPTTDEAISAASLAHHRLVKAEAMWPRVNRVSTTLTRELEENNFAGRIRMALEGR